MAGFGLALLAEATHREGQVVATEGSEQWVHRYFVRLAVHTHRIHIGGVRNELVVSDGMWAPGDLLISPKVQGLSLFDDSHLVAREISHHRKSVIHCVHCNEGFLTFVGGGIYLIQQLKVLLRASLHQTDPVIFGNRQLVWVLIVELNIVVAVDEKENDEGAIIFGKHLNTCVIINEFLIELFIQSVSCD